MNFLFFDAVLCLTLTSSTVTCARVMSADTEQGTKAPSEKASTCVSTSVLAKICARHKGQKEKHDITRDITHNSSLSLSLSPSKKSEVHHCDGKSLS